MSLQQMPPELLLEIAQFLDKNDIQALGSCHSAIRNKLTSSIFEKVYIVLHPKKSKQPGRQVSREISLKADWFDAQIHQPCLPDHIRSNVKSLSIKSSPHFLMDYRQLKFRDLPVDQLIDKFSNLGKLYFEVANPSTDKIRYLCMSSFEPRSRTIGSIFKKLNKKCGSEDQTTVELHTSMISGHIRLEMLETISNLTSLTLRSANSGWLDYDSTHWLSKVLNSSRRITSLDLRGQQEADTIPYMVDLDRLLNGIDVELNTLKRLRVNSLDLHIKPENFWKIKQIEELDFTLEPDLPYNSMIRRKRHPWKGSRTIWECMIAQRMHLKSIRYHTAYFDEFAWSPFMFYCNFVKASEVRQLDLSFKFCSTDAIRLDHNPTFKHLCRLFVKNTLPRFDRLQVEGGPMDTSCVMGALSEWLGM